MYCMVQKHKIVKQILKVINKNGFAEIQAADAKAYEKLLECQKHLKHDPGDIEKEVSFLS